ncbi:hypothetical protein AB1L30_11615 [Bremerella sp. JC817]|uniref:hypothetical protein n=1 Tax=Bremerella sp. JC817 TaxID=3231756 RepID=UPI003458E5A8
MTTIQELRNSLKHAIAEAEHANPSCSKSVFLDALRDCLMGTLPSGPASDRILTLLKRSNELPVFNSRLDESDLRRREDCLSWNSLDSSIQAIGDLVWEATTVSAGDCDECMGEELVYLWDAVSERMVKVCDLCSNTLDLEGRRIESTGRLEVPTRNQLEAVSVIESD